MEADSLAFIFQICVIAVLVIAAIGDFRTFRIPNELPLLIIVMFFVSFAVAPERASLVSHMTSFLLALALGLVAFRYKIMAGGDVKLIAAIALWFGVDQLHILLTLIALVGGLQSVSIILYFYVSRFLRRQSVDGTGDSGVRSAEGGSSLKGRRIPYGVSIAIGSIFAILLTSS